MADEQQGPPESSRRRVGFQFPWSAFVHYPQRTDPRDLPQTPPPESPPGSLPASTPGSPRASPTRTPRTWRRRRRARRTIGLECVYWTGFASVFAVGVVIFIYMSIGSDRVYVPLPSTEPWEYWRLRKSDHGYPRILLWNRIMKPFSDENASDAEMQWSWNLTGCPVRGRRTHTVFCEITDNRSRFEWSDAIVFEANRLSMYDLPNRWPRFPIWVLWAPIHLSPDSEEPPNVYPDAVRTRFNWTMGRREDADIVVPYKSWRCGVRGDTTLHETAERNRKALGGSVRSGQVAWICSTCETEAYREIRESSWHSEDKSGGVGIRHVDMDTFDKCGRGTCTTPLECVRLIAAHYNFIVVRLQPDCFDSPYELIYEAFEYDLVPVVLAPPNTTLNVPPHSVVNSANIQQPGELAAFLAAIMDNPSEYQRYFTWKRHCSLSPNEVDLCPLCHALYEKFPRRQAHRDAYEWWKMRTACPAYAPPLYGLDWAFFKTDVPWL